MYYFPSSSQLISSTKFSQRLYHHLKCDKVIKKIRQKCLFYTIITSSDPRCATTHGYNQLNGWFLKKHKSSWAKETLLAINQSLNDNKERKCDFPIIIPPNDNNKGVPIHLFTTDIEEDA